MQCCRSPHQQPREVSIGTEKSAAPSAPLCRTSAKNSSKLGTGSSSMPTCASWVMIPAKREWWMAAGPPCEASFSEQYQAATRAEPASSIST